MSLCVLSKLLLFFLRYGLNQSLRKIHRAVLRLCVSENFQVGSQLEKCRNCSISLLFRSFASFSKPSKLFLKTTFHNQKFVLWNAVEFWCVEFGPGGAKTLWACPQHFCRKGPCLLAHDRSSRHPTLRVVQHCPGKLPAVMAYEGFRRFQEQSFLHYRTQAWANKGASGSHIFNKFLGTLIVGMFGRRIWPYGAFSRIE